MQEESDDRFKYTGVNHVALVTDDMAKTVDFYCNVLDMKLIKTFELPNGKGQHFFFDGGNGVPALSNIIIDPSNALYGNTTEDVFNSCVEDEKNAGAKLAKDWAILPAADKARCVHAAIYLPSYVEWLTCIEGESTLRRIRKDSTAAPRG